MLHEPLHPAFMGGGVARAPSPAGGSPPRLYEADEGAERRDAGCGMRDAEGGRRADM